MTKYLQEKFSVNVGGKDYADGWERTFGSKEPDFCDGCHGCTEPCHKVEIQVTDGVDPQRVFDAIKEAYESVYMPMRRSDIRCQVEEFHIAFGHPVNKHPMVPERERLQLRLRLVAEEFVELLEACGAAEGCNLEDVRREIANAINYQRYDCVSLVGVADALADLDYVVEGMRLEMGINGKPIADEVHRSNMSKLGEDDKPVYREDGKVAKGPNYSPPDVAGEIRRQGGDV